MAKWHSDRVKQPGSVVLKAWNEQRRAEKDLATRAAAQRNLQKRSFSAGLPNRTTSNFLSYNTSIDQDLRISLQTLRARSRAMAQNNAYGKKFIRLVGTNVVGHVGFTLQAQSGDWKGGKLVADYLANTAIQQAFAEWSKIGICDVTKKLSFSIACRLGIQGVAREGELLVRRVRGKGVNKFGYSLQFLDVDRLPVWHNATAPNGNLIRMSVELDTFGAPVAYHVLRGHPGESIADNTQQRFERVPADDVFHIFVPERPEQRRGIPWMTAGLEDIYHIGEFDQSALMAARKGADTLGFFVSPDGEPPSVGDETDENGNPIEVSQPGTYDVLPEGYDFRPNESSYPNGFYADFHKQCLRRISSALNVAFHELGNDLTEVSFSSIRSGTLSERDAWMEIQDWFIESFVTPVFLDWLETSLLMGAITQIGGSALPVAKIEKFKAHTFQARRWNWVDPRADIESAVTAIGNGIKSRTQVIHEQGLDPEQVWRELAEEEERLKSLGISIAPPQGMTAPPAAPAQDGNATPSKNDGGKK